MVDRPAQFDGNAVDQEPAAADFDLAEAHVAFDPLDQVAVPLQRQGQFVEMRLFGVPFQGILHVRDDLLGRFARLGGIQLDLRHGMLDGLAIRPLQRRFERKAIDLALRGIVERYAQLQFGIPIIPIEIRRKFQAADVELGQGEDAHRAVDAAQVMEDVVAGNRQRFGDRIDLHFEVQPILFADSRLSVISHSTGVKRFSL